VGYDAVERQTPEPWLMLTMIGTRFQIGREMRGKTSTNMQWSGVKGGRERR
jgi:hypothetical protein